MTVSLENAKSLACTLIRSEIPRAYSRLTNSIEVGDPGSGFYRSEDCKGPQLLKLLAANGIGKIAPRSWDCKLLLKEEDFYKIAPAPEVTNLRQALGIVQRQLADIPYLRLAHNNTIKVNLLAGPQKLFHGFERFSDAVWMLQRALVLDFDIEYHKPDAFNPSGYHSWIFNDEALNALHLNPEELRAGIAKREEEFKRQQESLSKSSTLTHKFSHRPWQT